MLQVDSFLRDRFPLAGRFKRSRESCGENIWRCSKFLTFAVVFVASLCQTLVQQLPRPLSHETTLTRSGVVLQAPWMLSCIEALVVLLIYFLGMPRPQLAHTPQRLRFSFTHSLEDVVLLSTARALWLSLAYGLGSSRNFHRYGGACAYVCAPTS
jgi:hypothetical protein